MTEHKFVVGITQMEAVPFTIAEHFTVGAFASLHPTAVAEHLIPVGPNLP